MTKGLTRLLVGVVALGLLLVAVHVVRGGGHREAVAYFTSTEGIYAGDEVRVLGVPVGKITDIEATDHGVKVTFDYDDDVKVPADAEAVIVSPSLVSSRYLQLTPQYSGGAQLASGAVIPLSRTVVPVEFDQVKQQLDNLATTFGPHGVNKDGSLSRVITSGDKSLHGQGATINDTIAQLSRAVGVLDQSSPDLFASVEHLQVFVSALSSSNQAIRTFDRRLATVSTILARNRFTLLRSLHDLDLAVTDVQRFVRHNRSSLVSTVGQLARVISIVRSQRSSIEQILHVGPNALHNLVAAYDPKANSLGISLLTANTDNLRQFVCGALGSTGAPGSAAATAACARLAGPLLDALSGNLPLTSQDLTELEQLLLGVGKQSGATR